MRVVHVIARMNLGGTARWLEVITSGFLRAGHEVAIFAGDVQEGEVEDPSVRNLPIVRSKYLGRKISIEHDPRAFQELHGFLREFRPDIVNTHTAKAGVVGRLAARALGGRRPAIVHTIHGHLLYGYFRPRVSQLVAFSERAISHLSDLVLAAGDVVSSELLHRGAVGADRLLTVRPGVPDRDWPSQATALAELGVSPEPYSLVAGWLARVVPIKRLDRLIQAAEMNPEVLFLVGGDGPDRHELEMHRPPNVRFLGWTSPEAFWASCDLAVLTSDNEAIPYSLIEAALAGVPAVATNVGSVGEIVVDSLTGALVPASGSAVGQAIRFVSEDSGLRLQLGIEARKRALALFTPERMLRDHLSAYELAIHRRSRNL